MEPAPIPAEYVAEPPSFDVVRISPEGTAVIAGRAEPGAEVVFHGRAVRVSQPGQFLIGFGRDDTGPFELEVRHPTGAITRRSLPIEARQYNIQRIDGLPKKMVTPPPELLVRIREEGAKVREARAFDTAELDLFVPFAWPAQGPISGVYGSQRILNGEPRQPHFGVDIAASTGTPVRAPAGGDIRLAEPDLYYSGGTVILDHGHGLSSSFLHMSRIDVEVGQRVAQGEVIGAIGATGRVTGAHLDWRMNWFERRLDPALLVEPQK